MTTFWTGGFTLPIRLLCLRGEFLIGGEGKEGSPSARCVIGTLLYERDRAQTSQQQHAPKNYMRRCQNLLRQHLTRRIGCSLIRAVERLMRLLPFPATGCFKLTTRLLHLSIFLAAIQTFRNARHVVGPLLKHQTHSDQQHRVRRSGCVCNDIKAL